MGMFIRNAEVERKARDLARRRGKTLTGAIGELLDKALAEEEANKPRRRATLEEMQAATERFRKLMGLDKAKLNATKADFDAMWEISGFEEPEIEPLKFGDDAGR